jgi:hypothetical protein
VDEAFECSILHRPCEWVADNHEVDESEVIEVLTRPGEDRAGRDGSRIALGQTSEERFRDHGI